MRNQIVASEIMKTAAICTAYVFDSASTVICPKSATSVLSSVPATAVLLPASPAPTAVVTNIIARNSRAAAQEHRGEESVL